MNIQERLILISRRGKEIRDALNTLERLAFKSASIAAIETEFTELRVALDTYVPPNYPDAYRIRGTPIEITEHLTGERDMLPALLHSPSSNGRAYTLTKGQRAILRERYGMTPTKEVVIDEIAVWPAAPTCVRHVVLRSTEHVDKGRRHVLNSAVIDDWVEFCSAVSQAEANEQINIDKERLAFRVDSLLDRAAGKVSRTVNGKTFVVIDKTRIVEHSITKGKILFKWLAEYDSIPQTADKPAQVREALREILLSHNEPGLAALVKEPKFFDDEVKKESAGNERFADLLSQYF